MTRSWQYYLTRPFNLFGASLWQTWYTSSITKEVLGVTIPDALLLEEYKNLVRHYHKENQQAAFLSAIKKISQNPARCAKLLTRGEQLNQEAREYLTGTRLGFFDLETAVNFLVSLAIHATIFPFLLGEVAELKSFLPKLIRQIKKLRNQSYYQRLLHEMIEPLALKTIRIREPNFPAAGLAVLTYQEILEGKQQRALKRLKKYKQGWRFVYQIHGKKPRVTWTNSVAALISKLEQDYTSQIQEGIVRGQVAYRGKVRGIARIVLTNKPGVAVFHKGDILMAVSTNPDLLPLMEKSAAFVTDEGGIACHAAIISRELNKPCVIGTKIATKVFKDGDLVEVDANTGMVRKIK